MSNNINYELELKKQVVRFLDELIEQFPYEPNFVLVRIWIKDQLSVEKFMQVAIVDLYPSKKYANEYCEINNKKVMELLDNLMSRGWKGSKPIFQKMYDESDEDDRKVLWQWFRLFIKLIDNHVKYTT